MAAEDGTKMAVRGSMSIFRMNRRDLISSGRMTESETMEMLRGFVEALCCAPDLEVLMSRRRAASATKSPRMEIRRSVEDEAPPDVPAEQLALLRQLVADAEVLAGGGFILPALHQLAFAAVTATIASIRGTPGGPYLSNRYHQVLAEFVDRYCGRAS
jgi:hypothetical protein